MFRYLCTILFFLQSIEGQLLTKKWIKPWQRCVLKSKNAMIFILEIGTDKDHVHFLLQSLPMKSPTSTVKMLKSITAREIFQRHPEIKKILWSEAFQSSGYFVNTASKFGNESTISKYVRDQGMDKEYDVLHKKDQMRLF